MAKSDRERELELAVLGGKDEFLAHISAAPEEDEEPESVRLPTIDSPDWSTVPKSRPPPNLVTPIPFPRWQLQDTSKVIIPPPGSNTGLGHCCWSGMGTSDAFVLLCRTRTMHRRRWAQKRDRSGRIRTISPASPSDRGDVTPSCNDPPTRERLGRNFNHFQPAKSKPQLSNGQIRTIHLQERIFSDAHKESE